MTPTFTDFTIAELEAMENPENPRWMPEPQMESLQASLSAFGLVEPLVVNTQTRRIVGGHQRIRAAKAEGLEKLSAVLVDLSAAEEITLNLALNKVRGTWDYGKLAQVLADIPTDDLLKTGFSEAEVDAIASSLPEIEDDDPGENDGVVDEHRNRTDEEVQEWVDASNKIQFGMFSRTIPLERYRRWVADLEARSNNGSSPVALGLLVAQDLGVDAIDQGESEFDEEED